jgi:hypothetical protein
MKVYPWLGIRSSLFLLVGASGGNPLLVMVSLDLM